MYKVKFIGDEGYNCEFSPAYGIVADFNVGESIEVKLDTAQSFGQVGTVVEGKSVGSRIIKAKGTVFRDVSEKKKLLRKVLSPFATGVLVINDKYKIRVEIAKPISFSPIKDNGRFTIEFLAPYPFFQNVNAETELIGAIEPLFKFPVNYSTQHQFGVKSKESYVTIINESDVRVPIEFTVIATAGINKFVLTNVDTMEKMQIDVKMAQGDELHFYRDNGIIYCTLSKNGVESDVREFISDDSDLYYLNHGTNYLVATDGVNDNFTAYFRYTEEVVAVYED